MDKTLKITSMVIILFINIFIGYGIYQYVMDSAVSQAEELGENERVEMVENKDGLNKSFSFGKKRPFAMLLLGVDTNSLEGRSDTIIVAVVNPETSEVNLLSIPRDTRVKVSGRYDKITHAHAYGLQTSINTVEEALNIPIHYYVKVNFKGFQELVDAIGGVEIDVKKNIRFHDRLTDDYFTLSAGKQTLSGTQALNYARYRGDAQGDFGRNKRQKEVVKALIDQSIDIRNLKSVLDIIGILGNNVDTNMSKKDILQNLISFKDISGENVNSINVKAYPKFIDPVSYVVIDDGEMERLRSVLDNLLEGKSLVEAEKEALKVN